MAGTHVRCSRVIGPIRMGANRRARAASASVGQRAAGSGCLMAVGGCHMPCETSRGAGNARRKGPVLLLPQEPGPVKVSQAATPSAAGPLVGGHEGRVAAAQGLVVHLARSEELGEGK